MAMYDTACSVMPHRSELSPPVPTCSLRKDLEFRSSKQIRSPELQSRRVRVSRFFKVERALATSLQLIKVHLWKMMEKANRQLFNTSSIVTEASLKTRGAPRVIILKITIRERLRDDHIETILRQPQNLIVGRDYCLSHFVMQTTKGPSAAFTVQRTMELS